MATIITPYARYSFDEVKHRGSGLLKGDEPVFAKAFSIVQQWLSGADIFVFHTSGSTGIPKEITLKRSQLEASAEGTIDALGLTPDEHILLCMNPAFIGGAMLLVRGLILNATISLQKPSGNPLEHIPANHPYTFASFTPMQLHELLLSTGNVKAKLNRFHHILLGGAAIQAQLETELKTLSAKVYHTYGMTETVSHIALKQIGKDDYFKALPGVELATNEHGCLAVRSDSTAGRWVFTNDVAELIDKRSFKVLGRIDDVINSGGIKIWPSKIEQALREILMELGMPHNVLVSAVPDERLGQKMIAVLEGAEPDHEMQETLRLLLEKKLGKYELPRAFYYSSAFILTDSGKVNKLQTLKMLNLQA